MTYLWSEITRWLGVAAIVLAALVPLCSGRLPLSTDGPDHLFRIVELDLALHQGLFWPRFAPDLLYGYGYPVFNYYAPPIYYIGVGLHALGLDYVPALLVILGASLLMGALGIFKATEAHFGAGAGYVAAAVYVFAPDVLMILLAHSGAPELLALAWLPWLIWSLQRAFARPGAWSAACLSLFYAALLFTHNVTAVIGTAIIAVCLGFEGINAVRHSGWQTGLRQTGLAAGALGTGLLMAAYFWLPAFLETRYVQINHMEVDYRTTFLSWSQLLPWPQPFDPRQEPTPVTMALGWPAAGLALAGSVAAFRQAQRAVRGRTVTYLALFLGLVAMALPFSQFIWDRVALLRLFQFPWRFIGPAVVLAALLSGACWGPAISSRKKRALAVVALVIILGYGLTYTWTRYFEPIIQPAGADIYEYEVTTNMLGTTAHREYLPVGVTTVPPNDTLAAAFTPGATVDRLDRASLPAFVTVQSSTSAGLAAQIQFSSPQAFTAQFLWFFFPGWQAQLDGSPLPLHASTPYGLLEAELPAGNHTLRVFFGTTPLRIAAGLLSLLGLAGLASGVIALRRLDRRRVFGWPTQPPAPRAANDRALLLTLAAVGLAVAALRLCLDQRDSVFRYARFDGQHVSGATLNLDVNFGDELNLIGLDRPAASPADQPIPVVLYWRVYATPSANFSTSVHLVDAAGQIFGLQDVYQPAGLPTTVFGPDNYEVDAHPLQPYPGTPPGHYRLVVGVYPQAGTGPALTVFDPNHAPSGNSVEVASVTLTPPRRAPTDAALNPQHLSGARLGPLALVGYDLPASRAAPGDDLAITFYWRVLTSAPDTRVRLRLVSAAGQALPLGDFGPVAGPLPASAWQVGAAWRAPQQFILPPTVAAGPATLQVSLINAAGQPLGDELPLGTLDVTTPKRQFSMPTMRTPGDWRFGNSLRLVGYDLPVTRLAPGSTLALTLYWQALAVTTRRYTVFVHLLDTQGQIVAQVDAPPLQGARPTTGWLPGEVLTDPYSLTLPTDVKPGTYTLETGLYDAETLQRLAVVTPGEQASDRLVIQEIEVQP